MRNSNINIILLLEESLSMLLILESFSLYTIFIILYEIQLVLMAMTGILCTSHLRQNYDQNKLNNAIQLIIIIT